MSFDEKYNRASSLSRLTFRLVIVALVIAIVNLLCILLNKNII